MNDDRVLQYLEKRLDRLEKKADETLESLVTIKTEAIRLKGLPSRIEKIEKREWKRAGMMTVISAIVSGIAIIFFGR